MAICTVFTESTMLFLIYRATRCEKQIQRSVILLKTDIFGLPIQPLSKGSQRLVQDQRSEIHHVKHHTVTSLFCIWPR
jgi:hypothetical protein